MDKLQQVLESAITQNNKVLAIWKAKLEEDPRSAMEWSLGTMEAVAHSHVYRQGLNALEHFKSHNSSDVMAAFKEYATGYALQKASNVESSTSITANRMNDYERQAWAKMAAFNGLWL